MKLSFRKHPRESGRASIGHPYQSVDIKVDGKVVGHISPPNWQSKDNMWRAYVAVIKEDISEDGNPNCEWKWEQIRHLFLNEVDARDCLKTFKEDIFKLNLHYFE
jgi:hypothetical protein